MSTSSPGATMGQRYFVFKDQQLYEHNPSGTWLPYGLIDPIFTPQRQPRSPMPGIRLFAVARHTQINLNLLFQYSFSLGDWIDHGEPDNSTSGANIGTATSDVMYGNRLYVGAHDGTLQEYMFSGAGAGWHNLGAVKPRPDTPPCVLYDGNMFLASTKGALIQMWRDEENQIWRFEDFGVPSKSAQVTHVGAPMPATNKIFYTCSDGTLRERWWNTAASRWEWSQHGRPPGGRADTVPVTVADGKLFVNCSTNSSASTSDKKLCERHWAGTQWLWVDHGYPNGTPLRDDAASDPISGSVYVVAADGHYYERRWDSGVGAWVWEPHGRP